MNYSLFKQGINKYFISHLRRRKQVESKNLTIISNNCIAGVLYHDNKMKFYSPTINLFIKEEDFVIFCEHLDEFLKCELVEERFQDSFPVMSLKIDNYKVEIYFMHYKSYNEARNSWNKRKNRINKNNLLFLLCTCQSEQQKEAIRRFIDLPYKTFIISNHKIKNYDNQIILPSDIYDHQFMYKGFTGKRYYENYYTLDHILKAIDI